MIKLTNYRRFKMIQISFYPVKTSLKNKYYNGNFNLIVITTISIQKIVWLFLTLRWLELQLFEF